MWFPTQEQEGSQSSDGTGPAAEMIINLIRTYHSRKSLGNSLPTVILYYFAFFDLNDIRGTTIEDISQAGH
jgi:hypothetical protein